MTLLRERQPTLEGGHQRLPFVNAMCKEIVGGRSRWRDTTKHLPAQKYDDPHVYSTQRQEDAVPFHMLHHPKEWRCLVSPNSQVYTTLSKIHKGKDDRLFETRRNYDIYSYLCCSTTVSYW